MAKRGQGEGTISKLKNGSYQGRLTVGYDEKGKQKRKAFYGKTKREVQEKMTVAKAELDKGTYIEPSKMTVAEWFDMWLHEYKKRSVRLSTYIKLERIIRLYINIALGKYKLKDLKKEQIQILINDLDDKGFSVGTIKNVCSALNDSLQQAVENELIIKNVAEKVILPKKEKKEKRVLSIEEQELFIDIAKNEYSGEIFIFALGTGLRLGEMLALTWDDIDFHEEILTVSKTLVRVKDVDQEGSKWHNEVGAPKTKASNRKVPLLPEIIKLLKNIKRQQRENMLRLGCEYKNNNLIFCNLKGDYFEDTAIQKRMRKIVNRMGIKGITIHSLRHTFATRGLENGIELKVIQEFLGHASIKITADIYTHVTEDKKKDSMKKLQNTINL